MTPQYRNTTTQPFSVTKGKKQKKKKKKQTKTGLCPWFSIALGRSFCLAASAVSGPVISFQMRKKCRLSPP